MGHDASTRKEVQQRMCVIYRRGWGARPQGCASPHSDRVDHQVSKDSHRVSAVVTLDARIMGDLFLFSFSVLYDFSII